MSNVCRAETSTDFPQIPEVSLKTVQKTGTYRIKSIIDDITLLTESGDVIRLVSLDIPDRHKTPQPDFVLQAYKELETAFAGRNVTLFQPPSTREGRTNRMGHKLGHLIRSEDKLWAQGVLLRKGLARVRTTQTNTHLADDMLALEQKARNDNSGLWAKEDYKVRTPETAGEKLNSFQIVEGTIRAVASINNTIYLNFGQNWRNDFTIALPVRLRRDFLANGQDPLKWQGKKVRVRGWVEKYNGPYIEIQHRQRLEFIAGETPDTTHDTQTPVKNTLSDGNTGHKLNFIPMNTKSERNDQDK